MKMKRKRRKRAILRGEGEIFGMWYREEGEMGNLSLSAASYSGRWKRK